MKKSLNAWSVPGGVSFAEMFRQLAAAGFEGVELNLEQDNASLHSLTMETTAAELKEIRLLAEASGLAVAGISTGLCGRFPLGSPEPSVREKGKDVIRRQLELAQSLGADGVLTAPGGHGTEVSLKRAHENVTAALSELAGEVRASGILLGVENVWNGFFLSPFDMARLIDDVACPSIGAYFDAGNVAVYSDPVHWAEILGRRIKKVHVKDFQRGGRVHSGEFVNLLEGGIRWAPLMRELRAAGYDGFLTAELSVIGQCPEFLYEITARALERILAM